MSLIGANIRTDVRFYREGLGVDRVILHSDCNCFYASVEMHRRPELRGTAMCVGGDVEARHGIVLAKSPLAKAAGVKTGEVLWQARQKCPGLIVVPPDYPTYLRYSRLCRQIYYDYTPLVEPFGLDECWLDITGSVHLFGGDAGLVAREISERVKFELGITVSIGVSFNKVFAKFGSDADTGDGIAFITRDNYRDTVWPLPVGELIYVGPATERKLKAIGIDTIGELACADEQVLRRTLGKMGAVLQCFALGQDTSPVKPLDRTRIDVLREIKSVGNGLTAPHDICCRSDAKALIWLLSESVAQRLRELHFRASCVTIGVREAKTLTGYTRQRQLRRPSCDTRTIARCAFSLLTANEPLDETHPLRGLHVRATQLSRADQPWQTDLFGDEERAVTRERLDACIDEARRRFGNKCIVRGVELTDSSTSALDIKGDNIIHPVSYFA